MKRLSIVMPFLNEGEEPLRTIDSIYASGYKEEVEVIAIDDFSDRSFTDFSAYPEVKVHRNNQRVGVAASRDKGVALAETDNILIIDGHMRFCQDGWLDRMVTALDEQPNTLFCTTCVALAENQMDMQKATQKYYGANIVLVDETQANSPIAAQILEPKWAEPQEKDEYEIPCILGANYAVKKSWYQRIKGLEGLQKWGGDEVFLSLKTRLAGGSCRLLKDIEIGHMFRDHAPYVTQMFHMYYNKMWMCWTLFPEELAYQLLGFIPHTNEKKIAQIHISDQWLHIQAVRAYYKGIFTRTPAEVFEELGLEIPKT